MKNTLFSISFVLSILFLFSLTLLSQPCKVDCDYLEWEHTLPNIYGSFTLPSCPGYTWLYKASAREGYCEPEHSYYYEYTIDEIVYDGTLYPPIPQCERTELLRRAQESLLYRMYEIFQTRMSSSPPLISMPTVFFKIPVCWQYFPPPNGQSGWKKCPGDQYCCVGYLMAWSEKHGYEAWIVDYLEVSNSPDPEYECPEMPPTFIDCYNYGCDSLLVSNQQNMRPKRIELINHEATNFSTILPNPVTDDYELSFVSEELGSINLIISDNLGNTIEHIKFNKESYEFVLPLSSEGLVTGTYFFKLLKDDLVISEGAFTVVK